MENRDTVSIRYLLQLMWEDARAALERDPAAEGMRDIVLFSTGTHIVWAHRCHHWLWRRGHRLLALWLAKRTRRRLAADVHPAATVGHRLTIDHGMGVVIGSTAVIGDDCLIYQGVTLGMKATGDISGKRHPTLGSNVLVGAGATVLGPVHIGDGSRIGAGAVVVSDIEPGVTAVGVPARVMKAKDVTPMLRVIDGGCDGEKHDLGGDALWSCAL